MSPCKFCIQRNTLQTRKFVSSFLCLKCKKYMANDMQHAVNKKTHRIRLLYIFMRQKMQVWQVTGKLKKKQQFGQ